MQIIRPGPSLSPDAWRTVRAAIHGWGPTLRFITIIAAATACLIAVLVALQH